MVQKCPNRSEHTSKRLQVWTQQKYTHCQTGSMQASGMQSEANAASHGLGKSMLGWVPDKLTLKALGDRAGWGGPGRGVNGAMGRCTLGDRMNSPTLNAPKQAAQTDDADAALQTKIAIMC